MAKKFGGFTPEQQQTLLAKLGYDGPAQQDDINKYMMASPKAASMMGRYAEMARKRVEGDATVGFAAGGYTTKKTGGDEPTWTVYDNNGNVVGSADSEGDLQSLMASLPALNTNASNTNKGNTNKGNTNKGNTGAATTGAATTGADTTGADTTAKDVTPYDPTKGAPSTVEAPDFKSLAANAMTGVAANEQELASNVVSNMLNEGNRVLNPYQYDVVQEGNSYKIKYKNGTVVDVSARSEEQARQRGDLVAKGLKASFPTYKQYKVDTRAYNKNLSSYQNYQQGLAQETTEDPQAMLEAAKEDVADYTALVNQYTQDLSKLPADDPSRASTEKSLEEAQLNLTRANASQQSATSIIEGNLPSTTELRDASLNDPNSMVTTADVVTTTKKQREEGMIDEDTGKLGGAKTAGVTTATTVADVKAPEARDAATVTADTVSAGVQGVMDKLTAATGLPSEEALAQAQTMDPNQLAQLGLTAAQIDEAVRVQAPAARTLQDGELIAGSTVDMGAVEQAVNFEAATGSPSSEATVQGQLTGLLSQFEDGQTPPWAAGAMRAATAALAARGMGASSLAGQAVVQAAMESALPIAQQDAKTYATFEIQNLSNRQATAMFAAEQRAKFLGLKFDQEFQTRVANAAKISDIANMNFTAEQQVALENARLAQTVDIANLNAKNAKVLADAAAMTQIDTANLNNRQQAAVQQANAFLQMDLANLDNEQSTAIFKAQSMAQAFLTDTAARNAARQFNALSENQTNQFYDNLTTTVAQFNNEQANAMRKFNAGEKNTVAQFNVSQINRRQEFNANNALVIAQANATWMQNITTTDNAAKNATNTAAAMQANKLTQTTYDNMLQVERDMYDYAWRTVDNFLQRNSALTIAELQAQTSVDIEKGKGVGSFINTALNFVASFDWD